jgi:hypothetical protein
MPTRAVVIRTTNQIAAGTLNQWSQFQAFQNVINDIATPGLNPAMDLNQIISGIPSPLARAKIFKYALLYQNAGNPQGIQMFYERLQKEWKGLLACIALDSAKIELNRVHLSYDDVQNIGINNLPPNRNIYEPTGAIGNMLFEDQQKWCVEQDYFQRLQIPFLFTIKYITRVNGQTRRILIGGTSPESILFTSPGYRLANIDAPYIDQNGKLTDPVTNQRCFPDHTQTQILYVYIARVMAQLQQYSDQFVPGDNQPSLVVVTFLWNFLNQWLQDIQGYANRLGYQININAFPANINIFKPPFAILFNNDNSLWGSNGVILTNQQGQNYVEFDPSELLISDQDNSVLEFTGIINAAVPIYFLQDEGTYFSLPLSPKAVSIFQDHMSDLLGLNKNPVIGSRLAASYNDANKSLTVTLTLDIEGNLVPIQRNYTGIKRVKGKHLIVWPDFVSKIWKDYYLFSELPEVDQNDIWITPLQASVSDYKFTGFDNNSFQHNAQRIVSYAFDNGYSYEIFKSDLPFKGVAFKIRKPENRLGDCGVILFKNLGNNCIRDFRNIKGVSTPLTPVNVGFDFGSNNICVSYKSVNTAAPSLIHFSPRKIFILGPQQNNLNAAAEPHDLLFFPSELIPGNHVKSMIVLHNQLAVLEGQAGFTREVCGGLPCFGHNFEVINTNNRNTYSVALSGNQGDGIAGINVMYNLKWTDNNIFTPARNSLYALVKSLWLMVYAELLEQDAYPQNLKWAYPSSMPPYLVNQYIALWRETAASVNPLNDPNYPNAVSAQLGQDRNRVLTESEAVANFALSNQGGMEVANNSLVMGFDVGGSTSDFFCAALDNGQTKIIRQTSIKELAAGRLADATARSNNIQNHLRAFYMNHQNQLPIYGINNYLNNSTAPYYFNAIVDKLSLVDGPVNLNLFYAYLNNAQCQELFVINAYLTGLLFYHAGQVSAKIKLSPQYQNINTIQIGFFGKGGRMVEWLPSINQVAANAYYSECFRKGHKTDGYVMQRFQPKVQFTKAEVSFGLSLFNLIQGVDGKHYDIIGEQGYSFKGKEINEFSDLQEYNEPILASIGVNFDVPVVFERFTQYIEVFADFIQRNHGFNTVQMLGTNIVIKPGDIGFIAYVKGLPDWQNALNNLQAGGKFDFHSSMFILQGMAFLENRLLPALFNNGN